MKKIAIYALTPQGAVLGRRMADQLDADLFLPARLAESHGAISFDRLLEMVAKSFFLYPRHVFIAAAGIVVRAIAPHLKSKDRDPAVIVLDQKGEYIISLLSGHLGGANELTRKVAQLTGGKAVITTATDTAGVPAIDVLAMERNLVIANLKAVKSINMAILRGDPVQVFDPDDRLCLKNQEQAGFNIEEIENKGQWVTERAGVWVTWKIKKPDPGMRQLVLHPKCLIAGMGCNRGTDSHEILDLITSTFRINDLAVKSLKCLATIEAKRDETGLAEAASKLGVPLMFASPLEIKSIEVPNPSKMVKKHMGVSSVCEATALLKSGGGNLLVAKTKTRNATLAVAMES